MLNVEEVYQETLRTATTQAHMALKKVFALRSCCINPDYIVAAYPYSFTSSVDKDMIEGVAKSDQEFTRVILDGNSFRNSEVIIAMSYDEFVKIVTS